MEGTPPGDALPPPPQRATAARKGARCGAGAGSTRPHRPHPGHTGRRTPAARSKGRAAGGGTAPDARRPSQRWQAPPRGRPSTTPTASNAGPQGRTLWGRCWVHTPAPTAPGHAGRGTLAARSGGRAAGEGQRLTPGAPHTVEGTPPGDALPPPPQRATPARKGARCEAGAGSTRPHRPHPGHAGHGALAARSGGRAAGGGAAPDTRRPSQRWKAPPRGRPSASPTASNASHKGARCGAGAGSTRPHRPQPGTHGSRNPGRTLRRTSGRGGTAPDARRPSQRWKAPPPGDALPPPPQRAASARKGARCGAGAGSTARIDRARDTRVAEPGCTLRRTGGRGRDSA